MAKSSHALTLLTTVFGYPSFRGNQAEVIDHVAALAYCPAHSSGS